MTEPCSWKEAMYLLILLCFKPHSKTISDLFGASHPEASKNRHYNSRSGLQPSAVWVFWDKLTVISEFAVKVLEKFKMAIEKGGHTL
jgi:hypothetical protein